MGGLAGSVPIPLDWDRDWQRWPTTCVLGALAGHNLGSLLALLRFFAMFSLFERNDKVSTGGKAKRKKKKNGRMTASKAD